MDETTKFNIVKQAVDSLDPCGLLLIGAPDDEYDLESQRISAAVSVGDTEDKIAEVAAEVFSKAFSREYTAEMFRRFALEVWREFELWSVKSGS